MAKNTGRGSRKGAVKGRTQTNNPVTDQWVERDEQKSGPSKSEFKNVKKDHKPFKGVAKEPDERQKKK